jgi:ribonuclease T2
MGMRVTRIFLTVALLFSARGAIAESFDYYTLAVSLTPAYCDQNPKWRDSLQCRDRLPFTVHGLWPEKAQGRSPDSCAGGALMLSAAQEKNLRDVMPDANLRKHEWQRHGSCSGLEPGAYFDLLAREFMQLKWPVLLQPQGRDVRVERAVVLQEFHRLNPGFPERGVVLRCESRGRPPLLSEIRVCLTPAGKPSECAANFKPNCPVAVQIRAR